MHCTGASGSQTTSHNGCNLQPVQLSACGADTSSTPPSQLCCSKIKEQSPASAHTLRIQTLRSSWTHLMPGKLPTPAKLPIPSAKLKLLLFQEPLSLSLSLSLSHIYMDNASLTLCVFWCLFYMSVAMANALSCDEK
uniref:Uncharacterized protein n=1 Tax=Cannabis sativa TaxID=3483 RepID=A0A803R0J2_CANSA